MKITLELVREVMREALGFESFTAGFVTSIEESNSHPTAAISRDGRLLYNPRFVSDHVGCREDLFSLVFHEILHPLFGHFVFEPGELENIAADAIINATISTLYSEQSLGGNIFQKLYSPRGLEGILRPESRLANSRYGLVYDALYKTWGRSKDELSTGELIRALKILTPAGESLRGILLIGGHGLLESSGASEDLARLPEELLARMAEDVKRSVRGKTSQQAGFSNDLVGMLMEVLATHLSIRRLLLEKFTTKRKLDRFVELCREHRTCVSPLPICPSKRDLVLLGSGIYPLHFRNRLEQRVPRERGLAIYLDVSGSVNLYLPKILGVLQNLRREIKSAFQFSNKVVESSFEELVRGKVRTTHGTDFDCVARSILERGFDKALIITDGFASLSTLLAAELKARRLATLTIVFHRLQTCEPFEAFGEVVRLEDVCQ